MLKQTHPPTHPLTHLPTYPFSILLPTHPPTTGRGGKSNAPDPSEEDSARDGWTRRASSLPSPTQTPLLAHLPKEVGGRRPLVSHSRQQGRRENPPTHPKTHSSSFEPPLSYHPPTHPPTNSTKNYRPASGTAGAGTHWLTMIWTRFFMGTSSRYVPPTHPPPTHPL